MIRVNVAWDRKAATIAEEKGFEALANRTKKDVVFGSMEFDTIGEAKAYVAGITESNGWDDPFTEIVPDNDHTDLVDDLKAQLKHSYIEFKVLENATEIDDLCRRNEMYGSMNLAEYVLLRLGVSKEEITELTNFIPNSK